MSVSIPRVRVEEEERELNREKKAEWTPGRVSWQQENEKHTLAVFQTRKIHPEKKKTINTSKLKAISAFYTGRNSKVVLIPKHFIWVWCTGVCLSVIDAPKWPSISRYINKLNGEKCSPNRQQLVITVMLLSRHNKPWMWWRERKK